MAWEERIKTAYIDAPWCSGMALASILVWLSSFLGWQAPMQGLGGKLDLEHVWRWLTYPLANPIPASGFIWFMLGVFFFVLFISELEIRWGSSRFVRLTAGLTLLTAGAKWAGFNMAAQASGGLVSIEMWGLAIPAAALFMMWCALNPEATVMFMLVFPIKAKYLALIDLAWVFFDDDRVTGLSSSLILLGAWFWARRYGQATAKASKEKPLARLHAWWLARNKLRRKGKFQLLEGGAGERSLSRIGELKLATKPEKIQKTPDPFSLELDRILDKIRFEGMSALTKEERATLDQQSQRLRDKS